jgi:hypothetical protein
MASKKKQNFEKKRKKKHVSSTSTENISEFTLQNVVGLGGDEVGLRNCLFLIIHLKK